jgi:manganese oxidase
MEMPLPANTLPMMSGGGPFGPIEMGGMFTVLKVRNDQKPRDYTKPGWFKHPEGTVAWEWNGDVPEPSRAAAPEADARTLHVQKPKAHNH